MLGEVKAAAQAALAQVEALVQAEPLALPALVALGAVLLTIAVLALAPQAAGSKASRGGAKGTRKSSRARKQVARWEPGDEDEPTTPARATRSATKPKKTPARAAKKTPAKATPAKTPAARGRSSTRKTPARGRSKSRSVSPVAGRTRAGGYVYLRFREMVFFCFLFLYY